MMAENRLRVCLAGAASRWASEIYVPALAAAAGCWQVTALLDLEAPLAAALPRLAAALSQSKPPRSYALTGHWPRDRAVLDAMNRACEPDLIIVSTAPDSHLGFARWSLENGSDIILDKPPAAFPNQFAAPGAAAALDEAFASLLEAGRRSRHRRFPARRCSVLSPLRRRAYWPYNAILTHVAEVQEITGIPPTYLYIGYNDGSYRFPPEYDRPGAHGYRTGLGVLTHTGYHFLDFAARCFSRSSGPIAIERASVVAATTAQDSRPGLDEAFLRLLTGNAAASVPGPQTHLPAAELDADLHFGLSIAETHYATLLLSLHHRGATRRLTPAYPLAQTHDEARVDDTAAILHQGPFQTVQMTILDDAGGAAPHGHCRLARRLHPLLAARLGVPERIVEDRLPAPGEPSAWYRDIAGRFLALCASGQEQVALKEFALEDQVLAMRLYSAAIKAAPMRNRAPS